MKNGSLMNNFDMSRNENAMVISRMAYKAVQFGTSLASMVSEAFTKWSANRETRRLLYSLSNAQLDDIGLTRSDVERMLNKHSSRG